jgi:hypothetical protein
METAASDKRRHHREKASTPLLVVLEDGLKRLAATMVDVSAGGARLQLAQDSELPGHFYMLFPKHRLQPCRLAWSEGNFAGVQYTL